MINETVPMIAEHILSIELPNGEFIRIDTNVDANGDYRIELLDSTGEFKAGLQSKALTD